jgi:hypothetical protein
MLRFRTFMKLSIPERNNPTAFKTDSITTRLIYKSYIRIVLWRKSQKHEQDRF